MKKVSFTNPKELTFKNGEGKRFLLHKGTVHGYLDIDNFEDLNFCSKDMGYSQLNFYIRNDKSVFLHKSLLPPLTFWASSIDLATKTLRGMNPNLTINTNLDYRSKYMIELDDGSKIDGAFKYTDTQYGIEITDLALSIVCKFSETDSPNYQTIFYQKEISTVLWKNASIIYEDDFDVNAEDFVDLIEVESFDFDLDSSRLEII